MSPFDSLQEFHKQRVLRQLPKTWSLENSEQTLVNPERVIITVSIIIFIFIGILYAIG